jgi:hypothetical protein
MTIPTKNEKPIDDGKVGYLVLWLMGAPITLLFILWIIFGNNLIGAG